ncbi:MAG: 50S ribosomal protein L11 methyltransferase [Limisphaerales bacterium]
MTTSLEAEDAVTELLGATFGQPASSHFNAETKVSIVSIYFPQRKFLSREIRQELRAGMKRIENCALKIGPGKISVSKVRREDWAESWKRHFKPIEVSGALLVKPSWIKRKPRKNQAVVVLDPGLSFGTGQHPTTSFCLHQLVAVVCSVGAVRQPSSHKLDPTKSFLDLGTGSGILAIAAAKLGCAPVHALDFDPDCIRIAQANARLNRIEHKLKLVRGDVTKLPLKPARRYDLVCANLISNLLIAERRRIAGQLKSSGTLVLAGILKVEFGLVQSTFEALGMN